MGELTHNRLINEKSPYLLQHSRNPVDWFAWGNEAFEKASNEDKPIFLSIGYSTCHWCHVMEHESFEDEQVAKLMNETFVNIKVDREERPDIDAIYMAVCNMLTGSGGWPLTVIMTPDKKPFFAGTYFPKENKWGRIGMITLINQIDKVWKEKRKVALEQANLITSRLYSDSENRTISEFEPYLFGKAFDELLRDFDFENGGFGNAPKFPIAHHISYLLRYFKAEQSEKALQMAEITLEAIKCGGIFDHIGNGFHRYSTDEKWHIPHFEKMLYDQAMLLIAFAETYQLTKNEEYKETATKVFDYLFREMQSYDNAFYSAQDADSEGKEGLFYLWKFEEITKLLEKPEVFTKFYNIHPNGNIAESIEEHFREENVPFIRKPYKKALKEISEQFNLTESEIKTKLAQDISILFKHREKRIKPFLDDKILLDWNSLMLATLSISAKSFNSDALLYKATKLADFLINTFIKTDDSLHHIFKDGSTSVDGMLDDYSFLAWGLIELYEASAEIKYLTYAIKVTDLMLKYFHDNEKGAFYNSKINPELIVRKMEVYDGPTPSGNSVAMLNLLKLNKIAPEKNYLLVAEKLLKSLIAEVKHRPSAYTKFMSACSFLYNPQVEFIIAFSEQDFDFKQIQNIINSKFIPNKTIVYVEQNQKDEIQKISNQLSNYNLINNKPTVYICKDFTCSQGITDLEELEKIIFAL